MNLSSGRHLGTHFSDIASLATTRESGTRSQGYVENTQEGSASDSQSDTFSQASSDMYQHQVDMNANTMRKGKTKHLENPLDDPAREMDYSIKLIHKCTNPYGAEIYQDPIKRYVYKTQDNPTPFEEEPMVNCQDNLYMGMDGACYRVTKDPLHVDAWGVLQADLLGSEAPTSELQKPRASAKEMTREPTSNAANHEAEMSYKPTSSGESSNPFEDNAFENLGLHEKEPESLSFQFWEWTPMRDIWVVKVLQDDCLQEVFKDSLDVYYATTKLPYLDTPIRHKLTLQKIEDQTRIVDTYGSQFRTLEWYEIRNLKWKGQPLFYVASPTTTARPGDRAYEDETRVPTVVHHTSRPSMSEGTTVQQPMPPPRATSLHDHSARVTPDAGRPGPLRPMGRVDSPPLEPYVPRPIQRHEDEHHRKVRPSALQKMVKKYDGSGDPYDHVAAYRQAVHAE